MTFKRRLIITNILMVLIPLLLLAVLAAVLLTGVFIRKDGAGDGSVGDIVQVDRDALQRELQPGGSIFSVMVIWGASAVVCTGVSFSLGMGYISHKLLTPLHELRGTVSEISDGNLDVEVLGCGMSEVDELCTAIDELRMRLRRSVSEQVALERERSLMLANLSHDLRTPVTAIKGYADGLLDGVASTPEMRERYIRTIYSRANDMERMIEQTSDFSELELGRMRFDFEVFDLAADIGELCRDFATDFEAVGAELAFENSSGEARVRGDRVKLRRVCTNLLSNAMKYRSAERPLRVVVTAATAGASLRVSVQDNGVGIGEQALERIFEGFFRSDPSRGGTPGHGLGLAISRQIVEKHGGRIWAQSRVGEGTKMYFSIPLAEGSGQKGVAAHGSAENSNS